MYSPKGERAKQRAKQYAVSYIADNTKVSFLSLSHLDGAVQRVVTDGEGLKVAEAVNASQSC